MATPRKPGAGAASPEGKPADKSAGKVTLPPSAAAAGGSGDDLKEEVKEAPLGAPGAIAKEYKEGGPAIAEIQILELEAALKKHLEAKQKISNQVNPEMACMLELDRQLEVLARNRTLGAQARTTSAMNSLMQAYANVYVDEWSKSMGHAKRGKNLQFLEDFLGKSAWLVTPATAKEKVDERCCRTFASTPERADDAVDLLFDRAMVEGAINDDASVYVNACKFVVRMGPSAVRRWNVKLENLLRGVPAEALKQFKIPEDPDHQSQSDLTKTLTALKKNDPALVRAREKYHLEILLNKLREVSYGNKQALEKGFSADASGAQERLRILGEDNKLESLIKKLNRILQNKSSPTYNDEIHRAVMEVYLEAYISERRKGEIMGGTKKGPFLEKLEDILKFYHAKTGSPLFRGADTETSDATILSSVAAEAVSPATRQHLVDQVVFARALGEGFEASPSGALSERGRQTYVNCVKAIVRMGDAAMETWNAVAADVNARKSVSFPDLVINSLNRSETEINALLDRMAAAKEITGFISSGAFKPSRSGREPSGLSLRADEGKGEAKLGAVQDERRALETKLAREASALVASRHPSPERRESGLEAELERKAAEVQAALGEERKKSKERARARVEAAARAAATETEAVMMRKPPAAGAATGAGAATSAGPAEVKAKPLSSPLLRPLNEFFTKIEVFHANADYLVYELEPLASLLEGADRDKFLFYLSPYRKLGYNSFVDPHGSDEDRVAAIVNAGARAKKEYELCPFSKLPRAGAEPNKLYVNWPSEGCLSYQVGGYDAATGKLTGALVEGRISKEEFQAIFLREDKEHGAEKARQFFRALEEKNVAALQPFLPVILRETTRRRDTQEYEHDFVFQKHLQDELDSMGAAVFNYDAFNALLGRMRKLPAVAKIAGAAELIDNALGSLNTLPIQIIFPVQYLPRYKLLLAEVLRHIPSDAPQRLLFTEFLKQIESQLTRANAALHGEHVGVCHMMVTSVIPRKADAEGGEHKRNIEGFPEASFVRVKNAEQKIDQLYYVKREGSEEQVSLLADASKAGGAEFLGQFDKLGLGAEPSGSKSLKSGAAAAAAHAESPFRKLDSKDLDAIEALGLRVHKRSEGDETKKELEKRFEQFRTSTMTPEQLGLLVGAMAKHAAEHGGGGRQDASIRSLEELRARLTTLMEEKMSDTLRMTRVREAVMGPYANLYVDEREKSWRGGTTKGKNLVFFEKVLEDFNVVVAPSEASISRVKATVDARIFGGFTYLPEYCQAVARELFTRAMSQGLGGEQNADVYVNARKAINRMGSHAINVWNELVLERVGSGEPSFFITGSSVALEEESKIRSNYQNALKNTGLVAGINSHYYIRILVNLLKEHMPNRELIASLEALEAKRDHEKGDVSALVHRQIMQAYVNGCFPAKGQGLHPVLVSDNKMQAVLREFQERTGNQLFGPLDFSRSINEKIIHDAALASVAAHPEEVRTFVKQFFDHALRSCFVAGTAGVEALHKKIFVNDVMAVIKMGKAAIDEWNALARQIPVPGWSNLVIQSTNQQEERLGHLYTALSQARPFVEYARQPRRDESVAASAELAGGALSLSSGRLAPPAL